MISPAITDEIEQAEIEVRKQLQPATPAQQVKPGLSDLVFDIETGPADTETIKALSEPYTAPPQPGEFDPRSVRTGNLKDPEKIMAKIEEAKQAHSLAVAAHVSSVANGEAEYWQKITEAAPLSPIIGRVLAIGFCDHQERAHTIAVGAIHDDDAEADILDEFWCEWYLATVKSGHRLIGHYIGGFDIPFLVRRSWILGVDVPHNVFDGGGKYLGRQFVDTKQIWQCGQFGAAGGGVPGNLDIIGRVFGEGAKTEGMTGADFWKLIYSGESESVKKALEYLRNDVVLNSRVARRMGVM
jgi:hypothetical protein